MTTPRKSLLPGNNPPTEKKETFQDNPLFQGMGEDTEQEEIQYPKRRKHGAIKFHDVHTQFTSYIRLEFEEPLKILMEAFREDKTALFNEALYDLFMKHRKTLEQEDIEVSKLPPYPVPTKR